MMELVAVKTSDEKRRGFAMNLKKNEKTISSDAADVLITMMSIT